MNYELLLPLMESNAANSEVRTALRENPYSFTMTTVLVIVLYNK